MAGPTSLALRKDGGHAASAFALRASADKSRLCPPYRLRSTTRPITALTRRLDDHALERAEVLLFDELDGKAAGHVAHDAPDDLADRERHAELRHDLGG